MDEARLAEATTEDVANIINVRLKDFIIVYKKLLMETGMPQEYVINHRLFVPVFFLVHEFYFE